MIVKTAVTGEPSVPPPPVLLKVIITVSFASSIESLIIGMVNVLIVSSAPNISFPYVAV